MYSEASWKQMRECRLKTPQCPAAASRANANASAWSSSSWSWCGCSPSFICLHCFQWKIMGLSRFCTATHSVFVVHGGDHSFNSVGVNFRSPLQHATYWLRSVECAHMRNSTTTLVCVCVQIFGFHATFRHCQRCQTALPCMLSTSSPLYKLALRLRHYKEVTHI